MARVYVGTYAKYNEGSIQGKWLNLEDYTGKEEFYEACKELHEDEIDPEFMFQDYEDVPSDMIGESFISDEVWAWLDMEEEDRAMLAAYRDNVGVATLEQAQEAFCGIYKSEADFAEEYTEDVYGKIPGYLVVDWQATWKYAFRHDYFSAETDQGLMFFRNC